MVSRFQIFQVLVIHLLLLSYSQKGFLKPLKDKQMYKRQPSTLYLMNVLSCKLKFSWLISAQCSKFSFYLKPSTIGAMQKWRCHGFIIHFWSWCHYSKWFWRGNIFSCEKCSWSSGPLIYFSWKINLLGNWLFFGLITVWQFICWKLQGVEACRSSFDVSRK